MHTHSFSLSHLSDGTLLAQLAELVARDRATMAAMLAHIAEVDHRKLYLPAACSTMHAYCINVLRLSEDAASRRIAAARAARRFPAILDAVADGRLHLTAVVMLAPHLGVSTAAAAAELIADATHRSKAEIEILLARRFPRPDLPTRVTPIAADPELPLSAPARMDAEPAAKRPTTRTRPLSAERFAVQVTIDKETNDMLERAKSLMRHESPSGDLAVVIRRSLEALLALLERRKFAATERPRRRRAATTAPAGRRRVPNEVKREVHARDGERCAFISDEGVRCEERGFLELDHVEPVARGGDGETGDRVRLLCRSHNQFEAERVFGRDFMVARRARAKIDAEAMDGLRKLDIKLADAREAMRRSADVPAATLEERLRAALASLRGIYGLGSRGGGAPMQAL